MVLNKHLKPLILLLVISFLVLVFMSSSSVYAKNPECPPKSPTTKSDDADGDKTKDWKYDEQVDEKGNKITYWCLDKGAGSYLALKFERVDGKGGWIGRCKFEGGDNFWAKDDVDENEDGVHDEYTRVKYTVEDTRIDDDGDGKTDDYHWEYDVRKNELTTKHTHDGEVVKNKTGPPPQDPAILGIFEDEEGSQAPSGTGEEVGRRWMKFTPDQYDSYMALRDRYWAEQRENSMHSDRIRTWQRVSLLAFLGGLVLMYFMRGSFDKGS